MALQLHPLEQIVNVAWGVSGVFAAGFWSMYADVYSVMAGAYGYSNADKDGKNGQPGFIFGGSVKISSIDTQAQIYFSENGKTWSKVWVDSFEQSEDDRWSSDFSAMVWNAKNKRFYAEVFQTNSHYAKRSSDGFSYLQSQKSYLILLSSGDGMSWSEEGKHLTYEYDGGDGSSAGEIVKEITAQEDAYGLISPYCNSKTKSKQGAPLPDGVFGYYETKDQKGNVIESILIEPTPAPNVSHCGGGVSGETSTIKITIEKDGKTETKTVSPHIQHINAVAYTGGVIVAVGGAANPPDYPETPSGPTEVAVSIDMGKTWGTTTGETTGIYRIVTSAPKQDLRLPPSEKDNVIIYGFKNGSASKINVPPPKPPPKKSFHVIKSSVPREDVF